jgi:hypothetical protein
MSALTYPLSPVCTYDYAASGDLGPIQMVSGGRMLRTLTVDGRYYGGIYAAINPDKPLSDEIRRVPGRDYVSFEIAPYETCHRNPEFRSRGESGGVMVPRYGSPGEHGDYVLWNQAAAALVGASHTLTSQYGSLSRVHFEQGRWRCGYVGSDGVDTVWRHSRALSAGLLRVASGHRPHFLAIDSAGAQYRLVAYWRREPETTDVVLDVAAIHLSGPTASIPEYLKRWVLGRCRGGW